MLLAAFFAIVLLWFDLSVILCYTIRQNFTGCEYVKKILCVFLSLILVISTMVLAPVSVSAASKIHVEDALETLQTKSGYIPGKTAAVTGNCFGFASAVCEKLYGKTYYYEQMNGSYRYNHTSDYYTVAQKAFSNPKDTAAKQKTAKQVKEFILSNAAAGDVLSYGCANDSTKHMHTVIIQHVDSEKLQVFHSNYACGNYSSAACHVDTLLWDSFLETPNTNMRNSSGDIVSLNKFFGAPMCCSNGMGLSLNRCSKLTSKYYLDTATLAAPKISTERKSSTSICFSWSKVDGAAAYTYSLSDSAGKMLYRNISTSATSATLSQLKTGEKYTFSVAASNAERGGETAVTALTCQPPAPSKPRVTASKSGICIQWNTRQDVSGYQIFRSTSKNGTFDLIATVTDKSKSAYTDKEVKAGTTYYYKVRRYLSAGQAVYYSNRSTVTDGVKISIFTPKNIKTTRTATTAIRVNWSSVPHASKYYVSFKVQGGKWKTYSTSACSYTFKSLKTTKKYYFRVKAYSPFGTSSYSSAVSKVAMPPTPTGVKVQKKSAKSVQISWTKSQGFDGYYILRSTDKSFKKHVKKIKVKNNKALTYTDQSVKKGTRYYYKVCRYTGKTSGYYSSVCSIKL